MNELPECLMYQITKHMDLKSITNLSITSRNHHQWLQPLIQHRLNTIRRSITEIANDPAFGAKGVRWVNVEVFANEWAAPPIPKLEFSYIYDRFGVDFLEHRVGYVDSNGIPYTLFSCHGVKRPCRETDLKGKVCDVYCRGSTLAMEAIIHDWLEHQDSRRLDHHVVCILVGAQSAEETEAKERLHAKCIELLHASFRGL